MNTETGEIVNIPLNVMDPKLTTLSATELEAIKNIQQEYRPIELAWIRYKRLMDPAEISLREVFESGFRAKEQWVDAK